MSQVYIAVENIFVLNVPVKLGWSILYTPRDFLLDFFFCVYHDRGFDGEWIHGNFWGKEVYNVMNLVEDRSGLQSFGQQYIW